VLLPKGNFLKKYRMAAEQWTVEKRDTDTYHKLLKNETMTFMKKLSFSKGLVQIIVE
jgi:hypothetical protein